jgi:glycosyltransferase involved in cell wall biosynthesis
VIARLNLGGPAQQAAMLSGRRFDPERYETLLVHGSLPAGEESMADLARREGARTLYLPSLAPPVNPANDLRALGSLIRIVRRFDPDIVHTHTAKAGFLGRQAALLAGRGRPHLVHTYHGHVLEGYFGPLKSGLYRRLERWLGKRTDVLIGVSQATVDDLVRLGVAPRERFRVIRLGLDLSAYVADGEAGRDQVRRELGVDPAELLVVYVGRIAPIKRLDLLVRATALAIEGGAPIRLAIVGDGEQRAQLESMAGELGIGDRCHFLGYRRDLPRIFAAGDVAAISSANEGTPVSLIEAGATGLPAIATDVGGVSDVVTPQTGLLVPDGDARALADALTRLASDQELRRRLGAAAPERVLSRFSIERLIADVKALYETMLAGGG